MKQFFLKLWDLRRFQFLMTQLVRRDFKLRYRGSVLGVLWSVLNPLLNMLVMSFVFSHVFRGVENYKLYLLAGLTIFNFFSEATNLACTSIVFNFGMITKVYFPKFIIPTAKVLTSSINLAITATVYMILGLFMGMKLWLGDFLVLYVFLCVLLFTFGIGYIMATLFVFFRDAQHLYGVVLTMWMYATPIMYPITVLPGNLIPIFQCNPLYQFINFFRDVTLNATMPTVQSFLTCAVWGFGMFVVGAVFFVKNQHKFIFYL